MLLMLATIFIKVIGFARDIVLTYFFGASVVTDAYNLSLNIPIVIFSFIGAGLMVGFIPIFNTVEKEEGTNQAEGFMNQLLLILTGFSLIVVILTCIFTKPIVRLFADNLSEETMRLTILYTRISVLGVLAATNIYIYNAYLQIRGNYTMTVMIGLPYNLLSIAGIAIGFYYGDVWIAVGTAVAITMQLILVVPALIRKNYNFLAWGSFKKDRIIQLLMNIMPVIIGSSVFQIELIVDRSMSADLGSGSVSALSYASRLDIGINSIFAFSIATVAFPLISKAMSQKNKAYSQERQQLEIIIEQGINTLCLCLIPIAIGAIVYARPIVSVLFERGAFESDDVLLTAEAFLFYSIGLLGYGLYEMVSRVYFSMESLKKILFFAIFALALNYILNKVLGDRWGIGGMALSTSISMLSTSLMMYLDIRKMLGFKKNLAHIKERALILAFSMIMIAFSYMIYRYSLRIFGESVSLVLGVGVGGLIYLLETMASGILKISDFTGRFRS